MKNFLVTIFLLLCQIAVGQNNPSMKWHIHLHFRDSTYGNLHLSIDTISGDTAKYYRELGKYTVTSAKGVTIVDGHKLGGMGTDCGCEALPHGYWIEKYRSGILKEQGKYYCNQKSGTWVYYHENGKIAKIENWKRPYPNILIDAIGDGRPSKRFFLMEGPYLEYYPNGQIRVDGNYKIVEQYSNTDTIFTVDPETYEEIPQIIEGKFWLPKSLKVGSWSNYSQKGELMSHEYYKINTLKDGNFRRIEESYWDLIFDIIDLHEKKKE